MNGTGIIKSKSAKIINLIPYLEQKSEEEDMLTKIIREKIEQYYRENPYSPEDDEESENNNLEKESVLTKFIMAKMEEYYKKHPYSVEDEE